MRNRTLLLATALVMALAGALPAYAGTGTVGPSGVAGAMGVATTDAGYDTSAETRSEAKKKKKCKKGSKKKGCKKPPPVKECAAFTPGEAGADAPLVPVTDAATEEAPATATVTLEPSTADAQVGDPSYAFVNLQVDSAAPDAGLYALIEFPARHDYDLDLLHPDGSYAARSHAWNTMIEANDQPVPAFGPLPSTGHGGESTASSEKLVGIRTADCGGWTLRVGNWFGTGGDREIKLWLGEVVNEPQAPGEEPA
ncbi:MAG: hypothetical protein ABR575_00305 [Actinomycetota bacterium]